MRWNWWLPRAASGCTFPSKQNPKRAAPVPAQPANHHFGPPTDRQLQLPGVFIYRRRELNEKGRGEESLVESGVQY